MGKLGEYQALPEKKDTKTGFGVPAEFMLYPPQPAPTAPPAPADMLDVKPPPTPVRQMAASTTRAPLIAAAAPKQQDLRPAFETAARDESCCDDECWRETCECLCQCVCMFLAAGLNGNSGGYHHHHHRHHHHGRRR